VRLAPERPVDRHDPKHFAAAEDFIRSLPYTSKRDPASDRPPLPLRTVNDAQRREGEGVVP
jgi:hypothetical protein